MKSLYKICLISSFYVLGIPALSNALPIDTSRQNCSIIDTTTLGKLCHGLLENQGKNSSAGSLWGQKKSGDYSLLNASSAFTNEKNSEQINNSFVSGSRNQSIFDAHKDNLITAQAESINPNDLCWYRHEGWEDGSNRWSNGRCNKVGTGWNFETAFAGSNGTLYGIRSNGDLCWYRHEGWEDGSNRWSNGRCNKVGTGWNFETAFAGSNGTLYGIRSNGDLCWYRHEGWEDGSNRWSNGRCTKVGTGWNFKTAFAGSNGTLYGIRP